MGRPKKILVNVVRAKLRSLGITDWKSATQNRNHSRKTGKRV